MAKGKFDLKDHRARQASRRIAINKAKTTNTLLSIGARISKDDKEEQKKDDNIAQ